jgi:hypothetical protein
VVFGSVEALMALLALMEAHRAAVTAKLAEL